MGFKKATTAYSVAHFVVDFSCAFLIYGYLRGSNQWIMCLLAYNSFAFAMQMPLGIVADYSGKSHRYAALGCVLVALSVLLKSLPLALCIVAGLGNGLFHIGAGRDVLIHSRGRYSMLGIFVSPGAVGLYMGMLAGRENLVSALVPVGLLLGSAAIILLLASKPDKAQPCEEKPREQGISAVTVLMIFCLFLVVCLRSYVGMTLAFPWKGEEQWSLWLLLALFGGKAFGGILADWLGAAETAVLSLLASALFFVLYNQPVCGVLAVFFFNMSMPIALGAVCEHLPRAKGFGFGLLTFGLFLGFAPLLLGQGAALELPWGYCAAALLSAVLLFVGLGGDRHAHKPALSMDVN